MRLKNPLYYYPVDTEKLLKCREDGDKRGARRQMKILGGIIPEPYGDEEAERLYRRQTRLTTAIEIAGGVAISLGAAGMELCDALFPNNDVLFMICFCAAMLGVLTIVALLPNVLGIRKKLIEHYLADYTPVCVQFDDRTRELCGKLGLFMSNNEGIIGEGFAEDGEENEFDFDYCLCVACGEKFPASEVTRYTDGEAVCPRCGQTEVTTGSLCSDSERAAVEYWAAVRLLNAQ